MAYYISGAEIANDVTLQHNSMTVYDGGLAIGTTVNSSGRFYVSSGGTAVSTTVNSGGYVRISGGTATSNTVNSGGSMVVENGGTASITTVNTGEFHISSGGTATDIVWTPCEGHVYVSDGGYATFVSQYSGVYYGSAGQLLSNAMTMDSMTLESACEMNVMSGGVANSTTVNSRGRMVVYDGGTATSAMLWSTGHLFVSSGGVANFTQVFAGRAGTYITISSGGVANSTMVRSGGSMVVENGGSANDTTLGGTIYVFRGGTANRTRVFSGGLFLSAGAMANDTILTNAIMTLSGGVANNTVGNRYGRITILSGGTANNTLVLSGTSLLVSNGGKITGRLTILPGAYVSFGSSSILDFDLTQTSEGALPLVSDLSLIMGTPSYTITVADNQASGVYALAAGADSFAGTISVRNTAGEILGTLSAGNPVLIGTVWYKLVKTCGDLSLAIGGDPVLPSVVSGVVLTGGTQSVNSGEAYYDTTVSAGGYLVVSSGGTANLFHVSTDGRVDVSSGGTAKRGTIENWIFDVLNSGLAIDTTVGSGGKMYVDIGGSAVCTTVSSGGSIHVYSDGRIDSTVVNVLGSLFLSGGGVANSTIVAGDTVNGSRTGVFYVLSGGVANSTLVNSVGYLDIASGGTALNIMENGGYVYVGEGAEVTFVPNTMVGLVLYSGMATLHSGTTALNTTVDFVGSLYVMSGGFASGIYVSYGGLNVSSGGIAEKISLAKGKVFVFNGGTVNATTIGGGSLYVDGGTANSTTVNSYGSMSINGGIANYTELTGGRVLVYGGAANSTTIAGGRMDLYAGTANYTTINAGFMVVNAGTANSTTINSGGFAAVGYFRLADQTTSIFRTGAASCTTINSGGVFMVSSGGVANSTTINDGGAYHVSVGGTANSTLVSSGGNFYVSGGGTISDAAVSAGGNLYVFSGGRLTGRMEIENGAMVYAFEGGFVDFNLTKTSAGAAALVNDFTLIQGTPLYTITVDGTQTDGIYKLARNAGGFVSTITVRDTAGTNLGELTVGGGKYKIGGLDYSLTVDAENVLTVSVGDTSPSPVIDFRASSDIDGNGISDVLFQYTGGDYQLGFWMNGSNQWQGNGLPHPAEWEVLGAYDMDSNGKADAMLVGNVVVNDVKGAYIGYYADGDDQDANWVNIGYLNNADDYTWNNAIGNLTGNEGKNSIVWHTPDLGALGVWTDGTDNWVGIGGGYDSSWTLVGCGDFSGGVADSVVMAYNGGEKYYAVDLDGAAAELGTSDRGWEVRAIGDFDGDGIDDIVVFHKETGLVVKWSDGNSVNWTQLGQLDSKNWFVVGCGDYNNDQKDDLLVRQYSTGRLGYYDGGDMQRWHLLGKGVDMNWTVIA